MYVLRNTDGEISAVSRVANGEINEFIRDDSVELHAFFEKMNAQQKASLKESDQAMARVLEDVINVLVDKGAIRFTDLPDAAQAKLLSRRELRGQRAGMNLLDDGDDLTI